MEEGRGRAVEDQAVAYFAMRASLDLPNIPPAQNRDLRVARDAMADELVTMRKGTRATRVAELQSEVFTSQIEMERLLEINRVRERRSCAGSLMGSINKMRCRGCARSLLQGHS